MEKLINEGKKTVILVTHKLQFLKDARRIVLIQDKRVVADGDFETVINSPEYKTFSEVHKELPE